MSNSSPNLCSQSANIVARRKDKRRSFDFHASEIPRCMVILGFMLVINNTRIQTVVKAAPNS